MKNKKKVKYYMGIYSWLIYRIIKNNTEIIYRERDTNFWLPSSYTVEEFYAAVKEADLVPLICKENEI